MSEEQYAEVGALKEAIKELCIIYLCGRVSYPVERLLRRAELDELIDSLAISVPEGVISNPEPVDEVAEAVKTFEQEIGEANIYNRSWEKLKSISKTMRLAFEKALVERDERLRAIEAAIKEPEKFKNMIRKYEETLSVRYSVTLNQAIAIGQFAEDVILELRDKLDAIRKAVRGE